MAVSILHSLWFFGQMQQFQNNFLVTRLHREALKQSATDPLSGKIDVGILTTGLSTTARKNRAELVAKIKDMLKAKGKLQTMPWDKLLSEIRDTSQIVSKWLNGKCNKTPHTHTHTEKQYKYFSK